MGDCYRDMIDIATSLAMFLVSAVYARAIGPGFNRCECTNELSFGQPQKPGQACLVYQLRVLAVKWPISDQVVLIGHGREAVWKCSCCRSAREAEP